MKKYFLILLIGFLFLMPGVKADTQVFTINSTFRDYFSQNVWNDIDTSIDNSNGTSSIETVYQQYYAFWQNYSSVYPYYAMIVVNSNNKTPTWHLRMFMFNDLTEITYTVLETQINIIFENNFALKQYDNFYNPSSGSIFQLTSSTDNYIYYSLYDTNYNFSLSGIDTIHINNFYSDSIILKDNSIIPSIRSMLNYDSFFDYDKDNNSEYTEVNLDNYEYVILLPKDQTKKDAYDVNLSVKGMIGITPVYEFGTSEKTEITDRCNISYSDYTDYRLYILKSDIQNNAVYYVKSCESGSMFKFKNSDFVVFYVTEENKNDPVITIAGQEYHTIPFSNLSNSANQNEENNFVPGESEFSLSSIIENIDDTLSSVWNSLTTFMSLITRFFNSLPVEFRTVCITTFTIICVIGVIKVIKS